MTKLKLDEATAYEPAREERGRQTSLLIGEVRITFEPIARPPPWLPKKVLLGGERSAFEGGRLASEDVTRDEASNRQASFDASFRGWELFNWGERNRYDRNPSSVKPPFQRGRRRWHLSNFQINGWRGEKARGLAGRWPKWGSLPAPQRNQQEGSTRSRLHENKPLKRRQRKTHFRYPLNGAFPGLKKVVGTS